MYFEVNKKVMRSSVRKPLFFFLQIYKVSFSSNDSVISAEFVKDQLEVFCTDYTMFRSFAYFVLIYKCFISKCEELYIIERAADNRRTLHTNKRRKDLRLSHER